MNDEAHIPEAWSPDGRHLSFAVLRDGVYSLSILALEAGTAEAFGDVQAVEPLSSTFSADGRWLAYHVLPTGVDGTAPSAGVFVEPFPRTGARYQAPKISRDFHPVWSREGMELHYIPSAASVQIATVRVSADAGLSFGAPLLRPFELTGLRISGQTRAFDVLPDGQFVGVGSGAPAERLNPLQLRFVVNWFEELTRLVPTE
jgi:hypothetical protein